MEKQEKQVDYAFIQKQTLEQFRLGKGLPGKGGAIAPLFAHF